jgi:hypothetical protein
LHRGPWSPSGHSEGSPLGGGVSTAHAPGRSTQGGTRGGGGSCHHAPRGHPGQPPGGGSLASPSTSGGGAVAQGRTLEHSPRGGAFSLPCGRSAGPAHGLSTDRAPGEGSRLPVPEAGEAPPWCPRAAHAGRQGRHGSRPQECPPGIGHGHGAPPRQRPAEEWGTRSSRREAGHASPARVSVVSGSPRHVGWARPQAQDQDTAAGGRGERRGPHGGRTVLLPGRRIPPTARGSRPCTTS